MKYTSIIILLMSIILLGNAVTKRLGNEKIKNWWFWISIGLVIVQLVIFFIQIKEGN